MIPGCACPEVLGTVQAAVAQSCLLSLLTRAPQNCSQSVVFCNQQRASKTKALARA